jgi:hypothetical protein
VLRSLEKHSATSMPTPQKAAMREDVPRPDVGAFRQHLDQGLDAAAPVAGESHDLGRVTADYAQMTTNHLIIEYRQDGCGVRAVREHGGHVNDKDNIRRKKSTTSSSTGYMAKPQSRARRIDRASSA